MTIRLYAFNGLMKSDLMEWPEPTPPEVLFPVKTGGPIWYGARGDLEVSTAPVMKKARFRWEGRYEIVDGGKTARVYNLDNEKDFV